MSSASSAVAVHPPWTTFAAAASLIVGHDHCLHQGMQFERLGATVRLLLDEGDRPVKAIRFPTGLMALTIGEGAARPRQSDRVGVTSGVAQRCGDR